MSSPSPDAIKTASEAARGFNLLECEECALTIQEALQRAGHRGQTIEIRGAAGKPFIVCKSVGGDTAISRNGRHIGVRVADTVFDNLHPNGLPFDGWIADFDAIGGIRVQSVTEF